MRALTHQQAQDLLQSSEALPVEENASLTAHLQTCPDCREFAAFHRLLSEQLPQAYPPTHHSDREVRQKAMAVQAALEKRARSGWVLSGARSLSAMATLLVVAFGLTVLVFQLIPGRADDLLTGRPVEILSTTQTAEALAFSTETRFPTNVLSTQTVEDLMAAGEPTQRLGAAGAGLPSPDGRWTAIQTQTTGQLVIEDGQGKSIPVGGENQFITPGSWSPDSTRLTFWQGTRSASVQADGLSLSVIEIATGQVTQLSESTLVYPDYQSWAPDGSALVFTNGGYRSAQFDKRLSLYEVATGQVRDLISEMDLVPAAVAWSPEGSRIAFAAVPTEQASLNNADSMSWENPAILNRRIYWLDPSTGASQRLNTAEAFQDAPRWNLDGKMLYYIEVNGDQVLVNAQPVPGADAGTALTDCKTNRPDDAGYYGHIEWAGVYAQCPQVSGDAPGQSSVTPAPQSIVQGIARNDHMAFIGVGSRLVALDLTLPSAPEWLSESDSLPAPITRVIKVPSPDYPMAAVGAGNTLALFDITNPRLLDPLGRLTLPGPVASMILDINTRTLYLSGPLDERDGVYQGYVAMVSVTDANRPRLLDLLQTEAPLTSLSLSKPSLFAAQSGDRQGVMVMQISGETLGEPAEVITGVTVYSMTAVRDHLYLGTGGSLLAYDISDPNQPQPLWQMETAGAIDGFELRPETVYLAGHDSSSANAPFRLALTPPGPLNTGSTIDTGSAVSVGNGLMLVADGVLEIYDVRDPQNFKPMATFPPARE